jgi:hypothetical protein
MQEEQIMKDDYLWDRSGEPDPEIERLEKLLSRFRHRRPAPDFAEIQAPHKQWRTFNRARWFWQLAALSAAMALVIAVWISVRQAKRVPMPTSRAGWAVARLAGTPQIGSKLMNKAEEAANLAVGQALETDSRSRASISVDDVGEIQIEPDTRLRLLETGSRRKRLALDHGTIRASIWAPPGEFMVDTPSALAIDMGCAYTLQIDNTGAGLLRTTVGWVGFGRNGRESFIPAGAACATRSGIGPGTPYFEDAPEPLRAALTQLDFDSGSVAERRTELTLILEQSRPRDALTLWHLLSRVDRTERGRVYDRLAALVPPPPHVTKGDILQLDPRMLDLWWDELGLGDISLWRHWERSWSERQDNLK